MLLDCAFYDVHAKVCQGESSQRKGILKREHKEHADKGEEREYLVRDHFLPFCY